MNFDMSGNYISEIEKKGYENFIIDIANKSLSSKKGKAKAKRNKNDPLFKHFNDKNDFELGIDEAGRGPLFGRLYVAGVILPKNDPEFKYEIIKDSKRFTSKKKLKEVYDYIIANCIDYHVSYKDEDYIDEHNIRQSVLDGMNECIMNIKTKPDFVLIDGCDFVNRTGNDDLKYTCIEGGDNWYVSIAAASILAKYERDSYIENMCDIHPHLDDKYSILSNKGYGTKKHIEGIKIHGITQFHRTSYGICKSYKKIDAVNDE